MNSDLNFVLGKLWACRVEQFQIDLCNHKIQLVIGNFSHVDDIHLQVTFNNVAAFFYINDKGDKLVNIPPWEYIEISEIHIIDNFEAFIYEQNRKIIEPIINSSKPNIVIEMWSSDLFIEAESISINGNTNYFRNQ